MNKLTRIGNVTLILLLVGLFTESIAQNRASYTPSSLSYQGYLTSNSTGPVNEDKLISFKIFDSQSAGTQLWDSGYLTVSVNEGYFSIILSAMESVFSGSQATLFLEIAVGTEVLSPRQEITAVPASLSSSNWNGGIVENPVEINNYLNVFGSGYFSGNIDASYGYFQNPVEAREELLVYDADLFAMYYQIDATTYSPRVLLNTENNYAIMELRDSNNQTQIELNASNGIVTCVSVQTGSLRILNSSGEVTFEIDPETGDVYYSGELRKRE